MRGGLLRAARAVPRGVGTEAKARSDATGTAVASPRPDLELPSVRHVPERTCTSLPSVRNVQSRQPARRLDTFARRGLPSTLNLS